MNLLMALNPLAIIGRVFLNFCAAIGRVVIFTFHGVRHVFAPPIYLRLIGKQMMVIGYFSLPVVGLTALFTGMVLALQIYLGSSRFNAENAVAWIVVLGITRELGPVLGGLMVAGRVASAMAAEIGTMRVTEQVDALRALAIDPVSYLVMPRFLSMVAMLTVLVIVGDATALLGGALTAKLLLGVDPRIFFSSFLELVGVDDVLIGIAKAFVFGIAIGVISSHFGISVSGGAVGVGRAVNNSVVASAVAIFVLNYLVTYLVI